jgi:eukaryotic-like serine/threonine-protein kinase
MTSPIASLFGRSLGMRLFVVSGALVLGAILAAVGFTAFRAGREADQWVAETLAASRAAQLRYEDQRIARLRLMSRLVAGDPSFVAYVAEGDAASIHDLLLERQRDLQCDLAVVLDRRGRTLARTDRAGGPSEDLSRHALVRSAMRRGDAAGVWSDGERHWTAVALPLVSGGELAEGILVTGLAIDDALALDVRRQSGAEVVFMTMLPEPRIIASTLASDAELSAALARQVDLPRLLAGPAGAPLRLTLDGRRWAVQATPLAAAEGQPAVAAPLIAVTLASVDQALAPFRRIEQALLLVGAVSLLLAFPLSYWLSRRISRPLERLADAADAARGGRFELALPAGGQDEVGRLTRAFGGLLLELREEREMEAYLQMLSRSLPDAARVPPEDGILNPGAVLGDRFVIQRWIGSGGMGVVYKARDRQLNEVIALKTLRPELSDAESMEGLKAELRVARRITHRNVLRTHDFGEADGVAFISMEYVRGVTLRELLTHDPKLPHSVVLRMARQLLAGLEAAHAMGVVHRDIKPENLILDPTGQLRIMDFGIAIAARPAPGADAGASLSGTPGYLSPEQLLGARGDVRSDLYATGVVLYEVLAGRRPFLASDPAELSYRQMNEDPPPLREHAPDVPESVEAAVLRCLSRDAMARFAGAAELAAALGEPHA